MKSGESQGEPRISNESLESGESETGAQNPQHPNRIVRKHQTGRREEEEGGGRRRKEEEGERERKKKVFQLRFN